MVVGVDPTTTVVVDHHVGGTFVGGDDTTLLESGTLERLHEDAALEVMVMVDEEGGRVQRIEPLGGDVSSARDMAASMTADQVRELARRRGRVMADLGISVDLAPVVDVSDQPDGTVIGDRSWSDDPTAVVEYAGPTRTAPRRRRRAGAEALPGARRRVRGHPRIAATTPDVEALSGRDLLPYEELLPRLGDRAAVMLGHLNVPGLTEPGTRTSLSRQRWPCCATSTGSTGW